MPIRINLLAEAQTLEDSRRRDPVKRAIWVGVFVIFVMLAWSSSLQLKALIARGDLSRFEAQIGSRADEYQVVQENQKKLAEVNHKLTSLLALATNRLLQATMLNALQQTTMDDVQLVRVRTEQSYLLTEGTKPKTNANHKIVPGKPATVTEKIVLTLDARDNGATPGDQVAKFKQGIADCEYFQAVLGKTNEVRLTNLSPPQSGSDGKAFVLFTLECRYPEVTR